MAEDGSSKLRTDLRWAIAGGVLAALVGFGGMALVGAVSSVEARRLLEATLPTVRFLASTLVAAAATILALMLTMLSVTASHDRQLSVRHYRRIQQIATMSAILIAGAVLLLLFLMVPIEESETVQGHYSFVYYGILFGAALSTGLLVAIVMMLNYAIRGVVDLFAPGAESHLVDGDDDVAPDESHERHSDAATRQGADGEREPASTSPR